MKRKAGIFLHPTSLPSKFGVGDLGEEAYRWVDLLAQYNQSIWQICPLSPIGYGNSPYNCLSSFAGNPLLISPVKLMDLGLLTNHELDSCPYLHNDYVDFDQAAQEKEKLFRMAFNRFKGNDDYYQFCEKENSWLEDYALFMTIKKLSQNQHWIQWEESLKNRTAEALKKTEKNHKEEIQFHKFLQFTFSTQWNWLKQYATHKKIEVLGDVPFYAAYDSCDIWAARELFELDINGAPLHMGGVPPDYFSQTGQLWGNPVYRWDVMKEDGYAWWSRRIEKTLELVDWVRIDHFRAFQAYWAIDGDSKTAINGEWVPGPGKDFFSLLRRHLGKLPVVAEDLGMITPDVHALRKSAGIPGMRVLQFAFDGGSDNPHRPHNIGIDSIVYTGTHDNNTTVGWLKTISPESKQYICSYLGCNPDEILPVMFRAAFMSAGIWCIIPFQDVLYLDEHHRMNTPGTADHNWEWRFTKEVIDPARMAAIQELTKLYGRE